MKSVSVCSETLIAALVIGAKANPDAPVNNNILSEGHHLVRSGIQSNQEGEQITANYEYPVEPGLPVPGLPKEYWPHELLHPQPHPHDLNLLGTANIAPLRLRHSPTGTFHNLVLLLRFSDHTSRELPSRDDIARLFNSEDTVIDESKELLKQKDNDVTPTGSVRQLYFSNSHSTFTVETTVVGWITLSNTESYYADGQKGLSKSKFKEAMIEALTMVDTDSEIKAEYGDFDFTNFDLDENGLLNGFGVLHSGYGAEFGGDDCYGTKQANRIWSHKGGVQWSSSDDSVRVNRFYVSSALRGKCKSNIVRQGVLVHEIGHYLGLGDLYDTTFDGKGMGAYDFMSQCWGFDGTGLYPSELSAFSKLQLGWATAESIEIDGTYELEISIPDKEYKVYKITKNFPEGEYLILENRQPIGYDSKLPGGGILIYHIDEHARNQRNRGYPSQKKWPENGNHYKVSLLPADGNYDLEQGANQGSEGDFWHSGSVRKELGSSLKDYPNSQTYQQGNVKSTGIRIFGFSASGNVMTFQVEGLGGSEQEKEPPTQSPSIAEELLLPTETPTRYPIDEQSKDDPLHLPSSKSIKLKGRQHGKPNGNLSSKNKKLKLNGRNGKKAISMTGSDIA